MSTVPRRPQSFQDGENLSNPERVCKALDKLDPIVDEAIKEFSLDAEDVEAVLDALKEKFRNSQ
jgi:hypothetical protein